MINNIHKFITVYTLKKISEILSQLNSIETNVYLFLLSGFFSSYKKYLTYLRGN